MTNKKIDSMMIEFTEDELFWLACLMNRTYLKDIRLEDIVTAKHASNKLRDAYKHISGEAI